MLDASFCVEKSVVWGWNMMCLVRVEMQVGEEIPMDMAVWLVETYVALVLSTNTHFTWTYAQGSVTCSTNCEYFVN